uniref:Uncharacterized protein n=1 Tax=Cacopsylla melanoneura TaxID=428564 RepID=A0A8D8X5F9_9HEMI
MSPSSFRFDNDPWFPKIPDTGHRNKVVSALVMVSFESMTWVCTDLVCISKMLSSVVSVAEECSNLILENVCLTLCSSFLKLFGAHVDKSLRLWLIVLKVLSNRGLCGSLMSTFSKSTISISLPSLFSIFFISLAAFLYLFTVR